MFRVISETQGLVWTGDDAERAEEVAVMVAVNTARTTYLQDGDSPEPRADAPRGISFTREQVEAWAGRRLTDDQMQQLEDTIPNSTFPETVGLVVDSMGIEYDEDEG